LPYVLAAVRTALGALAGGRLGGGPRPTLVGGRVRLAGAGSASRRARSLFAACGAGSTTSGRARCPSMREGAAAGRRRALDPRSRPLALLVIGA
jgi:hypothetical protein